MEDDYDGEFRYDRRSVAALQGLDSDHVVYARTASKVLAPAVRLGWLALPAALVDPVLEARGDGGQAPGALEQLTLAAMLDNGSFDRHLRRARAWYRRRRDSLLQAAALPGVVPVGVPAGLQVVLRSRPATRQRPTLCRSRRPSASGWSRSDPTGSDPATDQWAGSSSGSHVPQPTSSTAPSMR